MLRILRFVSLTLIHFLIAVIGTAILDTSLRRRFANPSHSFSAIIWMECLFSVVFATALGFSLWRIWRNSAAWYTWLPATAWFAIGVLATLTGNGVLGQLFPFGRGDRLDVPEIRSFFAFTLPLIRAVSYSLGAYVSSLFRAPREPSQV